MMESKFVYPQYLIDFNKVKDKNHLRQLFLQEMETNSIKNQFFTIFQTKSKIYARCSKCRSRLSFRYSTTEQCYMLVFFKNDHNHQNNQKKSSSSIQEICTFIRSFPCSLETSALKKISMRQFNITSNQFYYYRQKMNGTPSESFLNAYETLQKLKIACRYYPDNIDLKVGAPDIFMAVDQSIIKKIHKNTPLDVITFDITYNCIKDYKQYFDQTGLKKKKQWGIGLFCGKSFCNKPIILGFVFMNSQKEQDFSLVFQNFIEIAGSPSCIITDQQKSIGNALKRLIQKDIFKGIHRLDSFHIIHNLKKKLQTNPIFPLLKGCIFAQSIKQYDQLLQKAKNLVQTQTESKIIENFDELSTYYCFCKSPNQLFQGLYLNTSTHQKLNDFLKKKIPISLGVYQAVIKMLQFTVQTEYNSYKFEICKNQYQNMFENSDLKLVRFMVSDKIFQFFIKKYVKSLSLFFQKSRQTETVEFLFQDHKVKMIQGKYRCSCNQVSKTGIPCVHLLSVITSEKGTILSYFNQRWIIDEEQIAKQSSVFKHKISEIRSDRCRHTRRRMKNKY